MKTCDLSVDEVTRFFKLPCSGASSGDLESAWLQKLVELGSWAQAQLNRRRRQAALNRDNIWETFLLEAREPIPQPSYAGYCHWLTVLKAASGSIAPGRLTATDARQIADSLSAHYSSVSRMLRFYARIWRTLGLDATFWEGEAHRLCRSEHEHYRRLTADEIKCLFSHFSPGQDWHDMVVIGYYTGLRLSDVAELNKDEVLEGTRFLSLIPNKVRTRRTQPLTIPLMKAARQIVAKRLPHADADGFLFSAAARHRPSRGITAAFRRCGIEKQGSGRASFHSLRATFISLMDEAGVPPYITDAITGHSGGNMHARYTQPSREALYAAVERALPKIG